MSRKTRPINDQFCWIDTIDPAKASDNLLKMYQQVGAEHGKIHNLYKAFSLQPRPLLAADQHYRDILHNAENQSEPWFLELLASQTAIIAQCDYALTNHGANFKSLLGDPEKGEKMLQAVRDDDFDNPVLFSNKQSALLRYGAKLCRTPAQMNQSDIESLRQSGACDTEILEAVQATSCFAYWVRFINALGIKIGDESVGLFDENGNRRK
jgi:uncharacterized peroxidase-related enzyme